LLLELVAPSALTHGVIRYFSLFAIGLLAGCSGPHQALTVQQFQLLDQNTLITDEPMVAMEKQRRLHGAVSMAERQNRLGSYYSMYWNDAAGKDTGEVELTFEFQQGATASEIKKITRKFPSSDASGTAEFSIIGENYSKNGKVLAWKATLQRGNRVISTQKSYLWR
jgi:uncharacterized protein YcfL